MSPTGAGTAVQVAVLNNWSLDMTRDRQEVTAFEDANRTYVVGKKDVNGSFSGFWDSADDTIFDAADSADGVKMYLYPAENAPTIYWYGPAWVDASIETPADGPVGVSGTFVANGSWGRRP